MKTPNDPDVTEPTERVARGSSSVSGSVAIKGVCTFYHDGKKGKPIPIEVKNAIAKAELLASLMSDKEVEGFEIQWESH